jgi:hypothetical protein
MSSNKSVIGLCCLYAVAWILSTVSACGTEEGAGLRRESVTIDERGGTLSLQNAEVTVPTGALAGERKLTLTEGAEPPVGIPEEYEQASEFYTLEPHGLAFATPVTIRLPYRQVGHPPDLLRLDDNADTTWEPVPGVTFSNVEASFQTDHFCHLVTGGRKKCNDRDGDGFGIACDPGWDCDDDDPAVNPDAAEGPHNELTCQNNKDDDCDGLADGDDPDCWRCHTDIDCNDFNPCKTDTCSQGACIYSNAADGTLCDDNLYCTVDDSCLSGTCNGQARNCDDANFCTLDLCNEDLDRCDHPAQAIPGAEGPAQPGTCQNAVDDDCDGLTDTDDPDCNVCTTDSDCDDGLYCTDPDTCTGGVCTNSARDCSQIDDACNLGVCDEASNQCVTTPKADGAPCDDGLYCTVNDACQSGSCTLRDPRDCDDGDACTQDACNETLDQCSHILMPNPGAEGPAQPGTCSNGVDDDCDGLTDTDDPDC